MPGLNLLTRKKVYSTYHGVFSYAQINNDDILPDTLYQDAGETAGSSASQAELKNVASGGNTVVVPPPPWEFISKKGSAPSASTVVELRQMNHTINRDECCKWITFYSDLLSKQVVSGEDGNQDRLSMAMTINHTAFLMGNCLRLMTKDEFDVANHIQKTTKERLVNLFGPSSTDLVAAEVFFTPSFPIHEGLQRLHHQRERHSQNSWLSCSLKDLSKHKMRQLPVSGKLHASYHCHIPDSEQLGGL